MLKENNGNDAESSNVLHKIEQLGAFILHGSVIQTDLPEIIFSKSILKIQHSKIGLQKSSEPIVAEVLGILVVRVLLSPHFREFTGFDHGVDDGHDKSGHPNDHEETVLESFKFCAVRNI